MALKDLVYQLTPSEEKKKLQAKFTKNSSDRKDSGENNICFECDKSFLESSGLEVHISQEHNADKKFECKTCRKSYSTEENLLAHILQTHEKKFDCDSCETSFKSEQELKIHDNEDHTNNYDCEQCDYQSHSQVSLDKHIDYKHTHKSKQCKGIRGKKW